MKNLSRLSNFFLFIACLTLTINVFADVRIKSRQTMQGQTTENTVYIKGKRERTEMANGAMTTILQCDLRRDIQIMPQAQTFLINNFASGGDNAQTNQSEIPNPKSEIVMGGTVTTVVTNKDTGERKQMFGYTARHIITTTITESSPEACSQTKSKIETDGWYIDAAFALDCEMAHAQSYVNRSTQKSGCQDKSVYKIIGAAKLGYPVWTKMTMFDENGKESYSMTNEVVELSNAMLDAALFDIPVGYREIKDMSEMYKSSASSGITDNNSAGTSTVSSSMKTELSSDTAINQNVKNMATKTAEISASLGAKKPGVIRLGLATVKTGSIGEGMNATDLAAAIQNTLANYLKAPNVELVRLETKLPSAVDAEAKEKECDYVVYATASHKKGGGGFGFGKMLGQAVAQTGIGHTGSTVGNIAGQVATTAIVSAGQMSGNVKAKDEITLEYKLIPVGGATPALANTLKAKAKSNGEDVITPLVEQTAQAIVTTASKK